MNLVDCKSALKTLKSGLPIIFPTDTLPAIGCLPKFSNTIYEFKKRDRDKPLILMGSEYKQLIELCSRISQRRLRKNSFKILAWSSDNGYSCFRKADFNYHKQ